MKVFGPGLSGHRSTKVRRAGVVDVRCREVLATAEADKKDEKVKGNPARRAAAAAEYQSLARSGAPPGTRIATLWTPFQSHMNVTCWSAAMISLCDSTLLYCSASIGHSSCSPISSLLGTLKD